MRFETRSDDDRLIEAWAFLTTEEAYHLCGSLSYYGSGLTIAIAD